MEPETAYELKIKANNPAGSTDFSSSFQTLSSAEAKAGLGGRSNGGTQLGINFSNNDLVNADFEHLHFIVPLILALLLVLVAIAGFAVCIKRSKSNFLARA